MVHTLLGDAKMSEIHIDRWSIDYANPTRSNTYYVLQHSADGSYEVWDCDAFGPWSVAAGPFTGDDGYQRARNAYRTLA